MRLSWAKPRKTVCGPDASYFSNDPELGAIDLSDGTVARKYILNAGLSGIHENAKHEGIYP